MKYFKIALIAAALVTSVTVPTMTYAKQCGCQVEKGNNGLGNGVDPQPPGNPKPNDVP